MFVKSYIKCRNELLDVYERTDARAIPTGEQIRKAVKQMELGGESHVKTLEYITKGIEENLLFMRRFHD